MFMTYFQIMIKLNLHEIQTQISKYIEMVEASETVVVCKRNIPVAEIRPIAKIKKKIPEIGWADSRFEMPSDFKAMSKETLLQWEGDELDPLRKYVPKRKARKK